MKQYFETPTQVLFKQDEETMRENGVEWFAGIAYHDEIICGCCGGIMEIEEVEMIQPFSWNDLTVAIAEGIPLIALDPHGEE